MNRLTILAPIALPLVLAACPKEAAPSSSLPPAGLAGAPGQAGKAAPIPTVPMPSGQAPTGQPPAGHAAASQPGAPTGMPGAAPAMPQGHPPAAGQMPGGAASQPAGGAAMGQVIPGGGGLPAQPAKGAVELAGNVTEAHHVAEYTYVLVKDANGQETWAAVLKDETIGVGMKVELGREIWMQNFQSKSLNKTFDRILFGRLISKTSG